MPSPLFPRWATPAARAVLLLSLLGLVAVPGLMMGWVRTRYSTGEGRAPAQPVPFNHRLHAGAFAIDCRYCHATALSGASAGVPSTEICISCHQPVWLKGPAFALVRRSLASGRPIAWQRVNLLPRYVYFDHAAHTRHGIACESCHGRVDRMDRVRQAVPLTMGWCLDCHQSPESSVRPLAEVTTMGWTPPPGGRLADYRHELARRYRVQPRTACVTCHR